VPGHDVALFNAVPQQHATLEHFAQTSAALHPALYKFTEIRMREAWYVKTGYFPRERDSYCCIVKFEVFDVTALYWFIVWLC
jgi:hypothetical protein